MRSIKILSLTLAAAFSVGCASAYASSITVLNGDFQTSSAFTSSDPIAGPYNGGPIPFWSISGGGGQFQPNSNAFTSADGVNIVAYSNSGVISQTVDATVVAGTVYKFTVDLGYRKDQNVGFAGSADLLINGIHYAAVGTAPLAGDFSTYTATYVGLAGDAGQSITLELNSSGVQGDYDNATLTATTPEPGSIALLGTGLLGMGGIVRRRFVKA